MPETIAFTVWGQPQPGGSKKALPNRSKKPGAPPFIVVDANKKAKPWQKEIVAAAEPMMKKRDRFTGPLRLEAIFYLQRPKSHLRASGVVRDDAPRSPVSRPDLTKLLRPLEDALTGVVWDDDAQIVHQVASKRYVVSSPSVSVRVETM